MIIKKLSYWSVNSSHILPVIKAFTAALGKYQFSLIDGGASGGLSDPFNACRDLITSIRFEPRGEEKVVLSESDIYAEGGLWSENITLSLNIAEEPTASSICPPNKEFLERFCFKNNYLTRSTKQKVDVKLRSIDSCTKTNEIPYPNFIKLDVHSSELPALKGAINSLGECVGLLIETWHSEVHLDQGLHYEIEKFAIEQGFEVFDSVCAARWRHKYNEDLDPLDKGQYIGSEILFIRKNVKSELLTSKAFVLALFGFCNEAKNTLSKLPDPDISLQLVGAITEFQKNRRNSLKSRIKVILDKIKTVLSP